MKTSSELQDAVKAYQQGNQDSFTTIYEQSYQYLHTCAIHVVKNEDAAMDMLQETYMEISRSISQLKSTEDFLNWAAMIANRKCFAYLKKQKDVLLYDDNGDDEENGNLFDTIADNEAFIPEEILQDWEKQRLMREIIDGLSDMQRLCIIGYYYNEQKQEEIAQELGIPVNTVKTNLLTPASNAIKSGNRIKSVSYEDGTVAEWNEYEYDANGNRSKNISYNADGTVSGWKEYEYDANGNEVKNTSYDADGTVSGWNEYECDTNGNTIRWAEYDANGTAGEWNESEYDEKGNEIKAKYCWRISDDEFMRGGYEQEYDSTGNEIKCTYLNEDGTVDFSIEYEYDTSGKKIRETQYDASGSFDEQHLYEYDINGNKIKEICFFMDADTIDMWFKYEYDANGNEIKCNFFKGDGTSDGWTESEYIAMEVSKERAESIMSEVF